MKQKIKLIAEFCQNHNGSFDLVQRMLDAAASAGATHVKLQNIYTKNVVRREQFEHGSICENGEVFAIKRPFQDEYNRLKGLELTQEENRTFIEMANARGLIPMTTCFVRGDIKMLSELGYSEIKVASYDCASFPMLRELSERFSHVYVSTGASFDDEVKFAAKVLGEKADAYSFLHCVTLYPTPLDQLHLSRLEWLSSLSKQVGFSDHSHVESTGLIATKAAVCLGATIIERHFTVLPEAETKDGPVSISGDDLAEIKRFYGLETEAQESELDVLMPNWRAVVYGEVARRLSPEELLNRDYYRGRFATPRFDGSNKASEMIFNWEETPI